MGMVYTEITLKNVKDIGLAESGHIKEGDVRAVTVNALVDTGAYTLCITEDVFARLGLEVKGHKTAAVADGRRVSCSITAPVEIHWKDRITATMATVIPGSHKVLLGAIPLEGMDLMVNPATQEVCGVHGDEEVYCV